MESRAPLASSEDFSFCLANSASLQHCCRTLAVFSSHLQRLLCICMHISTGEDWSQHVCFSSPLHKNGRALSDVKSYHLKKAFPVCKLDYFVFLSLGNTCVDAHILKTSLDGKGIIHSMQLTTTNTLSTTRVCFHLSFLLHLITRATDPDKAFFERLLALPALYLEERNKRCFGLKMLVWSCFNQCSGQRSLSEIICSKQIQLGLLYQHNWEIGVQHLA